METINEPKRAFEEGVEKARTKIKRAKELADEMQINYQHGLWEYLEIEEV